MTKPYVVGISGGTADGKSTFCEKLKSGLHEFKTEIFHMDEYFKPESQRPYSKAFVTGKQYIDDNHPLTMDLEKLTVDIKKSLSSDIEIIIVEGLLTLWDENIYTLLDFKIFVDWKAGSIPRCLQRFNEVHYASYLTLLLLGYGHRQYNKFPLQRRYPRACSWVLHCAADEKIVRRIKRNSQWGKTFEEITDVYLDMVRYRHEEYVEPSKWRADIILNGSQFSDTALSMVTEFIYNKIKK